MRRKKEDALSTREAIVTAAAWCFQAFGVSGTTMAMIAERADLTRGAIYWHFKDQVEILHVIVERGHLPLADRLANVARISSNVLGALRDCLRQYLLEIEANEDVRTALEIMNWRCDFAGSLAAFRRRRREEQLQMLALLTVVMQKAKLFGELRVDVCCQSLAGLIGFALIGAVNVDSVHRVGAPGVADEVLASIDVALSAMVA